jgi:hypothetical protein
VTLAAVNIAAENPGCFGFPSVYNAKSAICQACACRPDCSKAVGDKLKAYASKANVIDFVRRHEHHNEQSTGNADVQITVKAERKTKAIQSKPELTAGESVMLDKLSVKPRNELRKLIEAGQHKGLLNALLAGQNPFPYDGKRYLHVACAMLLEGGFTKATLRERYMTQLGWTQNTAFPHVSMVCAMFDVLGVTQEKGGQFVVSPAGNQ